MEKFSRIADPRRPGIIRHKLTVLLTFGLFMFVFQCASRREANRELTRPTLWEHFREIFPEVETIPHMDTVQRILERIDPGELEEVMTPRVKHLLRSGRLQALLADRHYVIAQDGTQKASRGQSWASEFLHRRHGENEVSYMAYALEASLVSPQRVVLSFLTEFCENAAEQQEFEKQDSELKICKRLLTRQRKMFPKLRILVVADGLYPNGPMMALCDPSRVKNNRFVHAPSAAGQVMEGILDGCATDRDGKHHRPHSSGFGHSRSLPALGFSIRFNSWAESSCGAPRD